MKLLYDRGTILIYGRYGVPNGRWDERAGCYRAPAFCYRDIREYLTASGIPFEDHVLNPIPSPYLRSSAKLREYQREALACWMKEKRGTVVLPTGSGKTVLATKVIEAVNGSAFIVVPTLDLVDQWREVLEHALGQRIGELTGRRKEIEPITVSTYDSAYLNADTLGNRFLLLIFDEVHHLPAEAYRQIAEMFASPYRLGLTATYEREDGLHTDLSKLIGGIVYERRAGQLKGKYLAEYETRRIKVELTEMERDEYERCYAVFKAYIKKKRIVMRSAKDFEMVVMLSGRDREAREALLARNRAERIAFNSENKIGEVRSLLDRENRTIIFTRYNDMVYEISRRFFIPPITYRTEDDEREEILRKFRDGRYRAIVSSQVLDEGIDVPEANIGIVLSGTGSAREFVQRLGRLLRPGEGKRAVLYEVVTKGTKEISTSYRRGRGASG